MNDNPYLNLREKALTISSSDIGLGKPGKPSEPWGVLMEIGMTGATVTLVAFKDGTASIYLSSGGGYMGGSKYASIRKAAQQFVVEAAKFSGEMTAAADTPQPEKGQTVFYIRTDEGILTVSAGEMELGEKRHSLWPLFYAGQEVMTQYRLKTGG